MARVGYYTGKVYGNADLKGIKECCFVVKCQEPISLSDPDVIAAMDKARLLRVMFCRGCFQCEESQNDLLEKSRNNFQT